MFLVIKHWLGLYLTSNIIFLSSDFRCPFNPNDYSSSSRILGEERSFVETIFLQTFQVSLKICVSVYKSPHQLLLQHKVEQFQMWFGDYCPLWNVYYSNFPLPWHPSAWSVGLCFVCLFFLHLIFKTINFIGFYKNIPHGLNFLFLNGSSPDIVEEAVL